MSEPSFTDGASITKPNTEPDEHRPPRSDLKDAIGWLLLGIAAVVGAWRMDRLEGQNINPYTAPGLLPGLLGLAMVLLGVILFVRSVERGAMKQALLPATPLEREQRKRAIVAIGLCVGYSAVLVGHGIPFWLASTIYVTVAIAIFRRMSTREGEGKFTVRSFATALLIGVCSSVIVFFVFEKLFLVRLP